MFAVLSLIYVMFNHPEHVIPAYRSDVKTVEVFQNFTPNGLLTLFTTFSNNSDRSIIESNTIDNWSWLAKQSDDKMKCHCFYTNQSLKAINDKVDLNPYWSRSQVTNTFYDLPVVKDMFLGLQETTDTSYIGFSNSDILYDNLLLKSIQAVHDFHHNLHAAAPHPLLIVGRRTDVNATKIGVNVTGDIQIGSLKSKGKTCRVDTIDYFILNTHGYPWDDFVGVVVARNAWDNYMIAYALDNDVTTYDISNTVHAVHQSYSGKSSQGSKSANPNINKRMLERSKKGLLWHAARTGSTSKTSHYTKTKNGSIQIFERIRKKKT